MAKPIKKSSTEGKSSNETATNPYQQEMAALDRDLRENPPGRPRRPRR